MVDLLFIPLMIAVWGVVMYLFLKKVFPDEF